jgi:hypothetical protein
MLNGGSVSVKQTDQHISVEIDQNDMQMPTTIVVLELDTNAEDLAPIGETPVNRNGQVKSSNSDPSMDTFASDADMSTFWQADGSTDQPWLEYELGQERTISRAILLEGAYEGELARIHHVCIDVMVGDQWINVSDLYGWSGDRQDPMFNSWPMSVSHPEIRFKPTVTRRVRLRLIRVTDRPVIHSFELYER